jgi:hypothetical protein
MKRENRFSRQLLSPRCVICSPQSEESGTSHEQISTIEVSVHECRPAYIRELQAIFPHIIPSHSHCSSTIASTGNDTLTYTTESPLLVIPTMQHAREDLVKIGMCFYRFNHLVY